jgi:hypothetical protein
MMDSHDHYRLIGNKVEREHDLIHHRVSWLIAAEAFLFGAYALIASALPAATNVARPYQTTFERLHAVLPWLGILLATLGWLAVLAAIWVVYHLQKHRNKYISERSDQHPEVSGIATLPRVAGPIPTQIIGILPPALAPPLFIVCWLIVR